MSDNDVLVKEVVRLINEVGALKDLVAVLLAEISADGPDKLDRLNRIIESEREITYHSALVKDNPTASEQRVAIEKAAYKNEVFGLAQQILKRISPAR